MNAPAAALAVAALAAIAAGGVTSGFRRRDPVPVEGPVDPLQDRRVALLRSLADLEEAHASGALEDAEYRRLRRDTEGRVARLLRAIDGRSTPRAGDGHAASVALEPTGAALRTPGRVPPWAVASLLAATVLSVVVAGLLRDAEPAPRAVGPATGQDPFAFFEQRVREHPQDLAARLDLAHRYLDAGRIDEAVAEYSVALELDPDDAEALAHVGVILYQSGRPDQALDSVDRALETAPGYPEALFFRGVILLCGLERPAEAIGAFEGYLEAAPFGSERGTARTLIADAERGRTECSG
jgi:cytochrome c-type biogenesis protein CcmH/NrfG